jgi:hypothetical protein
MSWRAPSAAEEGGVGDALVGRRVRVKGLGEGTVTAGAREFSRWTIPMPPRPFSCFNQLLQ